jgi:hypothetical protein
MKKTIALLLSGLLVALIGSAIEPYETVLGQSPTPTTPTSAALADTPENRITFEEIDAGGDLLLLGPFDSRTLIFSLPPEWRPASGEAALLLDLNWTVSSLVPAQGESHVEGLIAGALNVTLNDAALDTNVLLGSGNDSLVISIPDSALSAGVNRLDIAWSASTACDFNLSSSLVVSRTSRLVIPHEEITLSPELASFPAPFYLAGAIRPISVTIVVPDFASQMELQAALAIAAGLGRQTTGELSIDLVAENSLAETTRDENHLILVGRWGSLSLTEALTLEVSENQAGSRGIVEVSTSPWNPGRAVLLVSGKDIEATYKAALAVSRGALLTGSPSGALALVSETVSDDLSESFSDKRTLADLGQEDLVFDTPGNSSRSFSFTIPPEAAAGTQSFLELRFSHSQLLDYLRSSIVVRLNDTPIGSLRLSDTTAAFSSTQMVIPPAGLRPGSNQIEIQADLTPRSICSDPRRANAWVAIYPDSSLYLPISSGTTSGKTATSLWNYPAPFTYSNTLGTTLFVLGIEDYDGWAAAARVAFDLGTHTPGGVFSAPAVALDTWDAAQFSEYDLLLVGQPDLLNVLPELWETLPVAFGPGNRPVEGAPVSIQFDTSSGAATSYLQSGKTTSGHTVLAVLGDTLLGLIGAADVLTGDLNAYQGANFAVVQNGAVLAEKVNPIGSPSPAEENTPITAGNNGETTGVGQPTAEIGDTAVGLPSIAQRQPWIFPSLVAAAALFVMILGWRLWLLLRSLKR